MEREKAEKAKAALLVPSDDTVSTWLNAESNPAASSLIVKYGTPGWIERLFEADPEATCVLIDFFAYSCTNCLRTVPHLNRFASEYGGKGGLRTVGFHRPEFEFEKEPENLQRFLDARGIDYPVGLDNDSAAWHAWKVESWPTHYLVARPAKAGGSINKYGDAHVGDRNHDLLENAICRILSTRRDKASIGYAELAAKAVAGGVPQLNRTVLYDLEFFYGLGHREKNYATDAPGCNDGACVFRPKGKPGKVRGNVKYQPTHTYMPATHAGIAHTNTVWGVCARVCV